MKWKQGETCCAKFSHRSIDEVARSTPWNAPNPVRSVGYTRAILATGDRPKERTAKQVSRVSVWEPEVHSLPWEENQKRNVEIETELYIELADSTRMRRRQRRHNLPDFWNAIGWCTVRQYTHRLESIFFRNHRREDAYSAAGWVLFGEAERSLSITSGDERWRRNTRVGSCIQSRGVGEIKWNCCA